MYKVGLKNFSFILLLFLLSFSACKDKETNKNKDSVPPSTDNSTIVVSQVTESSISLRWKGSSDNITHLDNVIYSVYISTASSLDTLELIETKGKLLHRFSLATASGTHLGDFDYSKGLISNQTIRNISSPHKAISPGGHNYVEAKISGLSKDTLYYLNIVTEDEVTNKNIYQGIQQKTNLFDTGIQLTLTPGAGTYSSDQMITITAEPTFGTTIMVYTSTEAVDISTLSKSDFVEYGSEIPVLGDKKELTIYAYGSHVSFPDSEIVSTTISIDYQMPQFSPSPGTYITPQSIALTTTVTDAKIYYTTDGSEPSTDKQLYSDPISLSVEVTSISIRAITVYDGIFSSTVATAQYHLLVEQVMTPVFTSPIPMGPYAEYNSGKPYVEILSTLGAAIYYTLDGTIPDESSLLFTPTSIRLDSTSDWDISLRAYKEGMIQSETTSRKFQLTTPVPLFNVSECIYSEPTVYSPSYYDCPSPFTVSISSADPSLPIYFKFGSCDAPTTSDPTYDGQTFTLTNPDLEGSCITAISNSPFLGLSYVTGIGLIRYQ